MRCGRCGVFDAFPAALHGAVGDTAGIVAVSGRAGRSVAAAAAEGEGYAMSTVAVEVGRDAEAVTVRGGGRAEASAARIWRRVSAATLGWWRAAAAARQG